MGQIVRRTHHRVPPLIRIFRPVSCCLSRIVTCNGNSNVNLVSQDSLGPCRTHRSDVQLWRQSQIRSFEDELKQYWSRTCDPCCAAKYAAVSPAAPPPTTMTSEELPSALAMTLQCRRLALAKAPARTAHEELAAAGSANAQRLQLDLRKAPFACWTLRLHRASWHCHRHGSRWPHMPELRDLKMQPRSSQTDGLSTQRHSIKGDLKSLSRDMGFPA